MLRALNVMPRYLDIIIDSNKEALMAGFSTVGGSEEAGR
jgi:hypothetical protein